MENNVAIICANGCEEGETLTLADILRRAEIPCTLVGLEGTEVTGAHDITLRTDAVFDGSLAAYTMVVLPGGYGGAAAMRASDDLLAALCERSEYGAWIAAICAAPIALDRAGLLEGKRFTCYPSTAQQIGSGTWVDEIVVVDGRLVTSQGPATAYAFGYRLAELLGADAEVVKARMVYANAFDEGVE